MTSQENNNSYVAGRFVAANYGRWSQVALWVPLNVTGSRSFVVLNPQVTLPDGRLILPFAINAPIIFGAETITPSAVAYNADNSRCTITADFTIEHSLNDPISSATIGLQEALNDAADFGGVVTVDGQWTNLGGTTLMITDADVPGNVAIEDVRTGLPSGGGIGGSGTAGFSATFATSSTLQDGLIDEGVTQAGALLLNGSGAVNVIDAVLLVGGSGGVIIDTIAGDVIPGSADGIVTIDAGLTVTIQTPEDFQLAAGNGLNISDSSASGMRITENGTGTLAIISNASLLDMEGNGVVIQDNSGAGLVITSPAGVSIGDFLIPKTFFSVAGTPLPDPTANPGTLAWVSDATIPTYRGVYVGGGAEVCLVITNGTDWLTI